MSLITMGANFQENLPTMNKFCPLETALILLVTVIPEKPFHTSKGNLSFTNGE